MTALHVLFVCTANICRSPYMELSARHLADNALDVSSAGTHGFVDYPMDPTMAAPLAARGIESESFRSRALTRAHIEAADVVLTAEDQHRRFVLDDAPAAFRKVFTLGQFAEAVRRNPHVSGSLLIAAAGARRPPSDPSADVSDPYRRGPAAAAASAATIDHFLRVVVPALSA